jgi:4'-phosphopantetheinyl transferase
MSTHLAFEPKTSAKNLLPPDWRKAPSAIRLPEDCVHLWKLKINDFIAHTNELASCLSPEEYARGCRFKGTPNRNSYFVRHAVLRILIAAYSQQRCEQVIFKLGPWGKPELESEGSSTLNFSHSHSAGLALYAFARNARIGVDIEELRPINDALELSTQYLSRTEAADVLKASIDERSEAFLKLWTQKEALLKVSGIGIGQGLQSLDAVLPDTWHKIPLSPDTGYVGAIVTDRDLRVDTFSVSAEALKRARNQLNDVWGSDFEQDHAHNRSDHVIDYVS